MTAGPTRATTRHVGIRLVDGPVDRPVGTLSVRGFGDSANSLLQQAEAHGLRPVHGCRQGICTRCTCTLLSGTVRDLRNGQLQHEPGQPIRICVSVPQGDVVVDL